jgi:hypothetical protein
MDLFGMTVIFFTCNLNAVHSPMFQVIFGDEHIDFKARFPFIVEYNEKAQRLVKDPVAAADFFEFSINCIFKYLFGWDFNTQESSVEGGILGHLKAWYDVNELTERGGLHAHIWIWLCGALNPLQMHWQLASLYYGTILGSSGQSPS